MGKNRNYREILISEMEEVIAQNRYASTFAQYDDYDFVDSYKYDGVSMEYNGKKYYFSSKFLAIFFFTVYNEIKQDEREKILSNFTDGYNRGYIEIEINLKNRLGFLDDSLDGKQAIVCKEYLDLYPIHSNFLFASIGKFIQIGYNQGQLYRLKEMMRDIDIIDAKLTRDNNKNSDPVPQYLKNHKSKIINIHTLDGEIPKFNPASSPYPYFDELERVGAKFTPAESTISGGIPYGVYAMWLAYKKTGVRINPTYNVEALKDHRENLYIEKELEYREGRAVYSEPQEGDLRLFRQEWLNAELKLISQWLHKEHNNIESSYEKLCNIEIQKYREYVDAEVGASSTSRPKRYVGIAVALEEYIKGASDNDLQTIIDHKILPIGATSKEWIGSKADAHRFCYRYGLSVSQFNKCFNMKIEAGSKKGITMELHGSIWDIISEHPIE